MNRNLSDLQFRHYDLPGNQHMIAVSNSNFSKRGVGGLTWSKDTGDVTGVSVDTPHQRRGIATHMWAMARDYDPPPRHSADRTDEGDAFARSTGDPLPRNVNRR
jgi:hypothetical protein